VYADPVAAFTTNPQEATIVAPTYNFMDQSTTPIGRIVKWSWSFADPSYDALDTLQNPSHTYPKIGEYCPMLTVTNTNGCVDTITHCIEIAADFTFFIPNAFSPNGDGINDTFFGEGIGITTYKMLVFDRWGNMIFTSYALTTPWDGRANGGNDVAQQDVYSYIVDLDDVFSKHHRFVGHVTLVR
jgi:gliding motility-associated-like protein